MTERVEAAAAVGFTRAAAEYERARPGYPAEAVALLARELRIGPGRRVADLAAGTGKLTRLLAPLGGGLVAVEPLDAMRQQFRGAVPGVPLVAGTAEDLPFAAASLDAVVVAQAFHWFDVRAALDELHRVLRPGGGLALVWNVRPRLGWAGELTALSDELRGGKASYRGDGWRESLLADHRFADLHEQVIDATLTMTPEEVVTQSASHSHIASMDAEHRAGVLAAIARFLAEHPETRGRATLDLLRPCAVHWCRRR